MAHLFYKKLVNPHNYYALALIQNNQQFFGSISETRKVLETEKIMKIKSDKLKDFNLQETLNQLTSTSSPFRYKKIFDDIDSYI